MPATAKEPAKDHPKDPAKVRTPKPAVLVQGAFAGSRGGAVRRERNCPGFSLRAVVVQRTARAGGGKRPGDGRADVPSTAGDIPESADEEPDVIERGDGSLLMNGMMAACEALDRLGISMVAEHAGFHTLAGFVIHHLGQIPATGDHFVWRGWRFEVVDMDGQRIDKVLVSRTPRTKLVPTCGPRSEQGRNYACPALPGP